MTEELEKEARFRTKCWKEQIADLEGKLRRAENLNYIDAKLIEEYGDRITELEKQLTKAKELINRIVEWADADHPKKYFEWIVKDLKQFLKE